MKLSTVIRKQPGYIPTRLKGGQLWRQPNGAHWLTINVPLNLAPNVPVQYYVLCLFMNGLDVDLEHRLLYPNGALAQKDWTYVTSVTTPIELA